jgi:hypothetical protein
MGVNQTMEMSILAELRKALGLAHESMAATDLPMRCPLNEGAQAACHRARHMFRESAVPITNPQIQGILERVEFLLELTSLRNGTTAVSPSESERTDPTRS